MMTTLSGWVRQKLWLGGERSQRSWFLLWPGLRRWAMRSWAWSWWWLSWRSWLPQAQVRNSNADDNHDDYVLPGWKFGGPNLCEDDAEAFDGASRLWSGAQEECDGEHFEEPREDPRLGEERGDVVSLNEEKTTHIKWTSNGTDKSRENLIILKKTSMRVFYVNMYWCYSQSQNGQWMECWSQFTDLKICF